MNINSFYIIFIVFFLSTSWVGCRKNGNVIHMDLREFSVKDQRLIGSAIKDEIYTRKDQYTVLNHSAYANGCFYLETLLKTLLTTSSVEHREDYDWSITILYDDNRSSAFVLPGGHLFIYTGLLKFLKAENELLAVLAHEIYYADTDMAVKRLANNIKDGGIVLGDIVLGHDVIELNALAQTVSTLEFSATDVISADDYAINLLCPFQYDAQGLRYIMEYAKASEKYIDWLETRPTSEQRLQNIANQASSCGSEEDTFMERYQNFLEKDLP